MGKALYRKYRSKSLAEIIGEEHITDTLSNAIKQGTFSHAYLFTGPRGTGKTSIARILAHQVNGLEYNEERAHLDIIEIDAASNRRIDEIRDLKERVHIAPTSAKYKVYIIDEVHMLTKEAFNALLKTLEEPPAHAIFILATTEAHKVPDTIISRTQRFTFKPVATNKVTAHLSYIATQEGIQIESTALDLIAAHGQGSFRDSISLLDQIRHIETQITLDHVRQALGHAPETMLASILDTIGSGQLAQLAGQLSQLKDQGVQPAQVAHQLSSMLRQDILRSRSTLDKSQTLVLLHNLAAVPAAHEPATSLELALYEAVLENTPISSSQTPELEVLPPAPQPVTNVLPKKPADAPPPPQINDAPSNKTNPETVAAASQPEPHTKAITTEQEVTPLSGLNDDETWQHILTAVKAHHNTLYGITRMAIPVFEPGKLTLTFAFAFHQKKLKDSKNHQALLAIVKDVTGEVIEIDFVTGPATKPALATAIKPAAPANIDLENISNIFGTAEVVQ